MTAMTPGANLPLTAQRVAVDVTAPTKLDVSALLLSPQGKVRSDEDFVFYNQPTAPGVTHSSGAADTITVETGAVPAEIDKVVVTASVDAGATFAGTEPTATVRDAASGSVLATFTPPQLGSETALLVVELYRRNEAWKVRAVGQGYANGLGGIATDFGVNVEGVAVARDRGVAAAESGGQAPGPRGGQRLGGGCPRALVGLGVRGAVVPAQVGAAGVPHDLPAALRPRDHVERGPPAVRGQALGVDGQPDPVRAGERPMPRQLDAGVHQSEEGEGEVPACHQPGGQRERHDVRVRGRERVRTRVVAAHLRVAAHVRGVGDGGREGECGLRQAGCGVGAPLGGRGEGSLEQVQGQWCRHQGSVGVVGGRLRRRAGTGRRRGPSGR
ncbi:TerD family protein [Streptomyces sp. PU-14G]|uniref:TerD family protein n=1 Tax=Streptomyces sp. PU-14G TaxID=2800808 RepID=UPI0034DF14F4